MKYALFSLLTISAATLTACGGGAAAQAAPGAGSASASGGATGPRCTAGDGNHLCLGLKYVAYDSASGTPVETQQAAVDSLQKINQEWSKCDLGFQIDEYDAVDPKSFGFNFDTANTTELDPIRTAFSNNQTLLVVMTGAWNRTGSLGNTGANAWTNMPGDGVYGAVLEQPVASFPLITAHELGHYLNLNHVSDQSDLMNPIIYDTSTGLTPDQCATARAAVNTYWPHMKR